MNKRPILIAATSGPFLCLAVFALLTFGSEDAEKDESKIAKKETAKVFRDNDFNGWIIPSIRASPSVLSLEDDLFDFHVSRSGGKLTAASVVLRPRKTKYFANPRKDEMVAGWPITKITTYRDLNGDGEFDWILKNVPNKERPNDPGDIKEFIIVEDSIVEIRHQRLAPEFRKEFVSIKGDRFVMSPNGCVKQ